MPGRNELERTVGRATAPTHRARLDGTVGLGRADAGRLRRPAVRLQVRARARGTTGGKVIVSDWQAANQLNTTSRTRSRTAQVLAATMRTLLAVTNDGHYKPDLSDGQITFADNVKEDADGKGGFTVHVKIRPDLKWSRRRAPHAERHEVHLAVGDGQGPGRASTTLGWEQVDKFDVAADGLSADIHFPKAFAGWLGLVGSNVHPARALHQDDPGQGLPPPRAYPVSADIAKSRSIGPFKYVTATADTIELARNDNWARPGRPASRPYLDERHLQVLPRQQGGR